MFLRKHIQSQDPLLVQQFSCHLGASSLQLALTLGGPGTSAAPPGPAAVSPSKASQLLEQLRNLQQKNPLEAIQCGEVTSGLGSICGSNCWRLQGTTDASSHPALPSHSSTNTSLETGELSYF